MEPSEATTQPGQGPKFAAVIQNLGQQIAALSIELAAAQANSDRLEKENAQLREELVQKPAQE